MEEFVTRSELRTLGADPRTVRKHLEPDAKLINGTQEIELFKRDRVKALAASIVSLERQVTAYAGHLLAALREQAAQRIFGVGFQELTSDGQRDAQARYRKALGRFISPGYTSLGRTHDKATVEQIDRRADQLLDDLDQLLTTKDFFNQD
jgi:hypothetical protein